MHLRLNLVKDVSLDIMHLIFLGKAEIYKSYKRPLNVNKHKNFHRYEVRREKVKLF